MRHDIIDSTLNLEKGQIHHVESGPGSRIACLSGALWLTMDGDPRDIVLSAGEAFTIDREGASLISALEDSRFIALWPQPVQ